MHTEELRLIRVRESVDIEPNAYKILYNGKVLTQMAIKSSEEVQQVESIFTALKPHLLLS